MPTQLSTLHLDYTSSDPIERAKLRITVTHTDERGVSYGESLMLDANDFPALKGLEGDVLAKLSERVGKAVEVLAIAEAVVADASAEDVLTETQDHGTEA